MKVIKYGEGYEPKVATCGHCKSEIEYINLDAKHTYFYYKCANGEVFLHAPSQDCSLMKVKNIQCPACNQYITVSEEYYCDYKAPEVPKKKLRWFK